MFYLYKLIFFPRICCESLKNREYYSNAWINNKKWLELYALIGSNRNFRINLLQQYKILPVYCLIKREFYVFSRYFEKNWSIEGMHERIKRCSNDEMIQSKHRNQETRKEKKERNIWMNAYFWLGDKLRVNICIWLGDFGSLSCSVWTLFTLMCACVVQCFQISIGF